MDGICATCGKTFTKRKPTSKYCCKECQYKGQIRNRPTAVCSTCGRTFTVERDRKGMYCSRECQHKSMEIVANYQTRAKLSTDYKRQYNDAVKWMMRMGRKLQYEQACIKRCEVCGVMFNALQANGKYCSQTCWNRHDNARRDKRIYRNGKPDLSISLTKLYMRDGGVCQLCGKEIDFDCDCNSDDYPSIDHIVPIAHGGVHEWSNVQLACRGCNWKKGCGDSQRCGTPSPSKIFHPFGGTVPAGVSPTATDFLKSPENFSPIFRFSRQLLIFRKR